MKKILLMLTLLMLCASAASATILPATGVDEDFQAWTGLECTPAVILCQSLSVYDERGDQGGRKVETLLYTGKDIPVIESWDGWAKIYYADGTKTGWVRSDYLMFDPAWYLCDEDVQVYAYPDAMSPRVALLDEGTKLPILTDYTDDRQREWVCVSLRGAAGWIRKNPNDTADQTWFRPEMLSDITGAVLECGGEAAGSTDRETLATLAEMLTNVRDQGGVMAGCPFDATLTLMLAGGQKVELQLATDSCCVYRVDNRDYSYARHLWSEEEGSPENSVLFSFFDMSPADAYGGGNG